jgi:hypothetical protein
MAKGMLLSSPTAHGEKTRPQGDIVGEISPSTALWEVLHEDRFKTHKRDCSEILVLLGWYHVCGNKTGFGEVINIKD